MKGLLLNNYYSMKDTIELSLIFCIFAGIYAWMVGNVELFFGTLYMQTTIFVLTSVLVFGADGTSKWNKQEITLPVKRIHIISSKYLIVIIFALVSCVISFFTALLFYFPNIEVNYTELLIHQLTALCDALGMVAIIIPLILLFSADKTVLFGFIAYCLLTITRSFVWGWIINFSQEYSTYNFSIALIPTVVTTIVLFILSYIMSVSIQRDKEF